MESNEMGMIGADCRNIIYDYLKQLNYNDCIDELNYKKNYCAVLIELRLYFFNRNYYTSMHKIQTDIVVVNNNSIPYIPLLVIRYRLII